MSRPCGGSLQNALPRPVCNTHCYIWQVCIGETHGVLTFGLPPQLPATDWTAVADAFSYYTVNVLAVSYGSTRLSRDSLPSNSIVDSGTTFM